jgi:hypothetical protein
MYMQYMNLRDERHKLNSLRECMCTGYLDAGMLFQKIAPL